MIPLVILVRSARGWNVVGDLRSTGMSPGQCSGEADAATGYLHAGRVRMSQWRSDCDPGGVEVSDRGDNGRLGVCATVDRDCLAFTEAGHVGGGQNSCSDTRGSAHRSGAARANCSDDGIFEIYTRIDKDRLAGTKAFHAGDLDVGCTRG